MGYDCTDSLPLLSYVDIDLVNTAKTACSYCILPRQLMSRIGKNVLADSEFFFVDDLQ